MKHLLFVPSLFIFTRLKESDAYNGVPGTTSTVSGYDTELGTDPVCWSGRSTALLEKNNETDTVVTPFPNPVVEDFELLGETKLLLECPTGIQFKGFAPAEFGTAPQYNDGIRPRTKQWYNYSLEFTIDQLGLQGNSLISDDDPTVVAVQVRALSGDRLSLLPLDGFTSNC
jgi:hypothetical protein